MADLKKEISEAYGVLTEDGIALRGLFIIDKEGVVQHATINNLAFGRSVDETKRVLQVRRAGTWGREAQCSRYCTGQAHGGTVGRERTQRLMVRSEGGAQQGIRCTTRYHGKAPQWPKHWLSQ